METRSLSSAPGVVARWGEIKWRTQSLKPCFQDRQVKDDTGLSIHSTEIRFGLS